MKKWFMFILIFLLSITNVNALVEPTQQFYVNDYANILSDETESYIFKQSVLLQQKTTAQVVVVTVPSLEGQSIEEYSNKLFNEFGIGDKNKNNGLLLLLALEERQMRVEVGYGLEETLTDGLTGRYQDKYIIPYLKEDKWDEGIKNGYTAFVKKIYNFYGTDIATLDDVVEFESDDDQSSIMFAIWFLFIFIGGLYSIISNKGIKIVMLFANVLCMILIYNSLEVGVMLCSIWNELIGYLTFRQLMNKEKGGGSDYGRWSSGGSDFGGWSSGGGGGGFSGGGGHSGGGGSSRSF